MFSQKAQWAEIARWGQRQFNDAAANCFPRLPTEFAEAFSRRARELCGFPIKVLARRFPLGISARAFANGPDCCRKHDRSSMYPRPPQP